MNCVKCGIAKPVLDPKTGVCAKCWIASLGKPLEIIDIAHPSVTPADFMEGESPDMLGAEIGYIDNVAPDGTALFHFEPAPIRRGRRPCKRCEDGVIVSQDRLCDHLFEEAKHARIA